MTRNAKHTLALPAAAPLLFFSLFAIIPAVCLGGSNERQRAVSTKISSFGESYQLVSYTVTEAN